MVAKWTNALGELLAVSFEIRLVRNLKGHKILLTKFDLEEQNIDIQFTVDSSNTNNVYPSKFQAFLNFMDPYMSGYQLQDSFPFLI